MRSVRWSWHRSRPRAPHNDLAATPHADATDGRGIAELLDNVHKLRLTLAADLATAASAIDADELAIARDILEADAAEVRRLVGPVATAPQPAAPRRRRALLALPAIPLMGALAVTGAAALSGGHTPAVSTSGHVQTEPVAGHTPQQISRTATSALQQLERAMSHPHEGRVVELAAHLHKQLTALIATSANDPAQLGEVQHLLSVEQQLLEKQSGQAAAIALAASRKVTHLLRISGLTTDGPTPPPAIIATSKSSPPPSTKPSAKPTRKATPTTPSSTKPRPMSSPPPAALPGTTPSPAHTPHRHHHHKDIPQPLWQPGLINQTP